MSWNYCLEIVMDLIENKRALHDPLFDQCIRYYFADITQLNLLFTKGCVDSFNDDVSGCITRLVRLKNTSGTLFTVRCKVADNKLNNCDVLELQFTDLDAMHVIRDSMRMDPLKVIKAGALTSLIAFKNKGRFCKHPESCIKPTQYKNDELAHIYRLEINEVVIEYVPSASPCQQVYDVESIYYYPDLDQAAGELLSIPLFFYDSNQALMGRNIRSVCIKDSSDNMVVCLLAEHLASGSLDSLQLAFNGDLLKNRAHTIDFSAIHGARGSTNDLRISVADYDGHRWVLVPHEEYSRFLSCNFHLLQPSQYIMRPFVLRLEWPKTDEMEGGFVLSSLYADFNEAVLSLKDKDFVYLMSDEVLKNGAPSILQKVGIYNSQDGTELITIECRKPTGNSAEAQPLLTIFTARLTADQVKQAHDLAPFVRTVEMDRIVCAFSNPLAGKMARTRR